MVASITHPNGANGAETETPAAIGSALTVDRFGIGRDKLNDALTLVGKTNDRVTIERFWTYCSQRNLGRDQVSKLLRKPNSREFYSHDAVYQLLTGKRMRDGSNIAPMLKSIEAFLNQVQPNTKTGDFIRTRLYREMEAYFERAFRLKRIGFVFGKMSVGKSATARYIASDKASWLYTQMPTRGQLGDYLREVAAKSAMGARQTVANLRNRIIDAIPGGLIVDDADECFLSLRNAWGVATLQFIKEAYDRRERGVIIMMDNYGRDALLRGDSAARLERLWRRRIAPLQLPDAPYEEDLNLFARSVGLSPAPSKEIRVNVEWTDENGVDQCIEHKDSPLRLQTEIAGRDGIGVWRMLLQDAEELALEKGKDISWGAVLKAHALFAAMEKKAQPNEPPAKPRRER